MDYKVGDRIMYCNGDFRINGETGTIKRILEDNLDYDGREGIEVIWDNPRVKDILVYPPTNPGNYLWPSVFKVIKYREPDWRI